MSDKLTFNERERLEREVLPAVIDNPEYAAATIVRLERLRAENEALKKEYFLMLELIDLCATRSDDGDYLDPEYAFGKAVEIRVALRGKD